MNAPRNTRHRTPVIALCVGLMLFATDRFYCQSIWRRSALLHQHHQELNARPEFMLLAARSQDVNVAAGKCFFHRAPAGAEESLKAKAVRVKAHHRRHYQTNSSCCCSINPEKGGMQSIKSNPPIWITSSDQTNQRMLPTEPNNPTGGPLTSISLASD